ncbi:MAG: hypothetical protein M1833_004479 [Piccolia ochrophora]|nr:MAG: hypothetical protein M1833_004479 [Piccolia ochrophora]
MASPESLHAAQGSTEVDPNLGEKDSAYGGDDNDLYAVSEETAITSLSSSVLNYPIENGRRYHAYQEGKYVLPNDEIEKDRLDMSHHMMILATDGKHHLAPIGDNPQRILDIGTGTGIWCIEMGDKYPSAEILGNDLSAVQPTLVPPNVRFELDDVEAEWTYSNPFDYIHCRYLAGGIAEWPGLINKIYKHTKPGGWAEFQDYMMMYYSEDGSLEGTDYERWITIACEAAEKFGRTLSPARNLEERVRDAGFVDITHRVVKLPNGPWPDDPLLKQIGTFNMLNLLEGIEGFSMALFTRVLGWTAEEVQVLIAKVRKDCSNPNIHAQQDFHIVYGRRPEEEA